MNVPISIRFNKKQIDTLKQIARKMSVQFNRDISYADLIRNTIERDFPFAKDEERNIGLFLNAKE